MLLVTRSKDFGIQVHTTSPDPASQAPSSPLFSLPPSSYRFLRASPNMLLAATNSTVSIYAFKDDNHFALKASRDFSESFEIAELSASADLSHVSLVDKKGMLRLFSGESLKETYREQCQGSSGAVIMAPKWPSSTSRTPSNHFYRISGKKELSAYSITPQDCVEKNTAAVEGIHSIFTAPTSSICIAFCKGSAAASIQVFKEHQLVSAHNVGRADRVDVLFSSNSHYALITCHSEVDQSGQSYYGETFMHVLTLPTQTLPTSSLKRVNARGPFHDSSWFSADTFIALYGYMPATAALFSASSGDLIQPIAKPDEATRKSPIGSKNTVRCCGGLVVFAGLGNLPGSVEVFLCSNGNDIALTRVGAFEAPGCSVLEWTTAGDDMPVLLAATTHPRLRVDNHWALWSWTGARLFTSAAYKELYQVVPIGLAKPVASGKIDAATLKVAARLSAPARTAEPYRPPSLRAASPLAAPAASRASKEEKVLKRLHEKLDQITDLKVRKGRGEALEANQLEKIEREPELRREVEALMKLLNIN